MSVRQYWDLTKPKVVALIVFTALVGMFLAIPGLPTAQQALTGALGFLGIWLAASAAAAINQLLDAQIDAQMARTSWRPLVVGKVKPWQVLVFASVLIVLSMTILVMWVNVITAVLTFASLIGYAVIYTVYLKRATSQNIVIGGLAGATPPMLGWAAITGMQGPMDWVYASLLVLIIFIWTPPHFWALALYRNHDYAKAGLPMLPVTHGNQFTRLHILLYSVALVATTLLPYAIRMSGELYLVSALALGGMFVSYAWRLYRAYSDELARSMFRFSILYLALLFGALLVDHWVGLLR